MDPGSYHCLFLTRGYYTATNSSPRPFPWLPTETPPWASDSEGTFAARLHLCTIPAGACANAAHHANVVDVQIHLQVQDQVQDQETLTPVSSAVIKCRRSELS